MTRQPIPDAGLDDRLFFAGTAGSGKTYNAMGRVERLLAKGARVVIPDPLGVWWGLRLESGGKHPSGYPVVIFGGPHGDLPLTEHAGALIGETVAGMKESCILDLSQLGTKASEKRFMLAFLTELYRHTTGEPLHVIFDEADMWSPQRLLDKEGEAAKLLGMMETIVRRGRVKGFIPWLISQRPAVISKDVLSQADGLIAFKLTSSQDRDAIGDWVEGQADKAQWREIWASLPTMERGQGVVWIPGRGLLDTVQFPAKETFDSSRTPKRGERAQRAAALRPLDLTRLKARLATVEAEIKANDPRALRAEIAKLQRDLNAVRATNSVDPAALGAADQRGYVRGYRQGVDAAAELMKRQVTGLANAVGELRTLGPAAPKIAAVPQKLKQTGPLPPARKPVTPSPLTGEGLERPLQLIIDAIRWWNVMGIAAPSHAQAAFVAGYSHKSGTWATYLSRLRSNGFIEGRGDLVLTSMGHAQVNDPLVPPSGENLRAVVLGKIDAPLQRILGPILEAYPDGLSHQEASERSGYSAQSGTWATYLSRLRSLDLIEGRGELKAQAWLFPMKAAA